MPIHSPSGIRCTCTTRSVFMNVHLRMSSFVPMPLASSATANSRSSGVMRLALDEIDLRLDPRLAGTVAHRLGQPPPVQAVHVVAVPVLLHVAAPAPRRRVAVAGRRVHDLGGVECLQPPPAGPGDRSRLTVGPKRQHLGADQLDLLAGRVPVARAPRGRPRRARVPTGRPSRGSAGCRRVPRSAPARAPAAPTRVRRAGSRPTRCCAPNRSRRTSRPAGRLRRQVRSTSRSRQARRRGCRRSSRRGATASCRPDACG